MPTKELLELLTEAGHVGELTRLLFAFSRRRTAALGKVELVELTNQTAGAGYRYPNPEPTLKVALALGLLQKSGQVISLTEIGSLFLRLQGNRKLDLTFDQGCLLFGLFLDDSPMASRIRWIFSQFAYGQGGQLELRTIPAGWDPSIQTTIRILQQIGVVEERTTTLFIKAAFEPVLPRYLLEMTAMGEEELWERLEAQRLRAREAEELVLVEERKRLTGLKRVDLAELVVRISEEDVSAGYDIESFEQDGSPRLIEVKSSVGREIRFEWSTRERQMAAENREHYWIYFVPLAHLLQKRTLPIWMLGDPVALIRSGKLVERPSSYIVSVNVNRQGRKSRKILQGALQDWSA
jgi:hypothetical protein